jgi:hypothetical protein
LALHHAMTRQEIASLLVVMGCPSEKSLEMAAQLDKRAHQLMEKTGRSYDDSLVHLIELMKQGWAAQEKGF